MCFDMTEVLKQAQVRLLKLEQSGTRRAGLNHLKPAAEHMPAALEMLKAPRSADVLVKHSKTRLISPGHPSSVQAGSQLMKVAGNFAMLQGSLDQAQPRPWEACQSVPPWLLPGSSFYTQWLPSD